MHLNIRRCITDTLECGLMLAFVNGVGANPHSRNPRHLTTCPEPVHGSFQVLARAQKERLGALLGELERHEGGDERYAASLQCAPS